MTSSISNRTGVAKELEFLQTWGEIFKQAFADTTDPRYDAMYWTCVDAFLALQGKATKRTIAAELSPQILIVGDYFGQLYVEGQLHHDISRRRRDYFSHIAELLTEKEPIGVVQARLF